jgi:hypothetical protein
MSLLKTGRYQKTPDGKYAIIARNEQECNTLLHLSTPERFSFKPENFNGPVIISDSPFNEYIADLFKKYGKPKVGTDNTVTCANNNTITTCTI